MMHPYGKSALGWLKAVAALSMMFAALPTNASVYGELMVHPTRIVFVGSKRTAQVELINGSQETVTYRVSFVNKKMTESGHFETLPSNADGKFADKLVHYSPRQFTLAPNASQIIRLSLRKPAALAAGEYRSHLSVQAIPPVRQARAAGQAQQDFSVELIPVFGLTLPVIVREGQLSVRVAIADVGFRPVVAKDPELLRVRLLRAGNRSVYGDITAYYKPVNGEERVVARSNGVALYAPNVSRTLFIPLTESPTRFRGGNLRVTYRESSAEGGRMLAEKTIVVR